MVRDGLVLFYVKGGVVYPVALSKEQQETFDIVVNLIPGTIRVVDLPQGPAINLGKEKR